MLSRCSQVPSAQPEFPDYTVDEVGMAEAAQKTSWLATRVEKALRGGLNRAYETVKVDADAYLLHLRVAHDLPVQTYEGMFSVPLEHLDDVAEQTIRAGMKLAAAEGAGFGLGGLFTLVPDLSLLSVITMRTIQKLSLVYGFLYNTDEEMAELWIAAASAAGVDISRELLERSVVKRFVPRVIQRIAARASVEVAEKWAGRIIPLASSVLGAGLNYYFVRTWAQRAASHFREKHRERRSKLNLPGSGTLIDAGRELTE
jgi:hypothetical protein